MNGFDGFLFHYAFAAEQAICPGPFVKAICDGFADFSFFGPAGIDAQAATDLRGAEGAPGFHARTFVHEPYYLAETVVDLFKQISALFKQNGAVVLQACSVGQVCGVDRVGYLCAEVWF